MKILPKGRFTWVLLLFIAYVYYADYTSRRKEALETKHAQTEQVEGQPVKADESLKNQLINKLKENPNAKVMIEALVKKSVEDKYGKGDMREIVARHTGGLALLDVMRGEGAKLHCGEKAIINYNAFTVSGVMFDSTRKGEIISPMEISTGRMKVIKGLESGIIGMKEGGHRKIAIPPHLAFNMPGFDNNILSKSEVVTYDVELMKVMPSPYQETDEIDVVKEAAGSGEDTLCGDKVKIKYSAIDTAGNPISNIAGEVEFNIGYGNVPIGFEYAVLGMKKGGTKTFALSNKLLDSAGKNTLPSWKKFAQDEKIQVQIELLK